MTEYSASGVQHQQIERKGEQGFTLIELSIVLVIIGLIVGGVLVGQDLIRAAEVRATISQIEKYNTAVNTFRGKFNAIPGDMNFATCSTFGFSTLARTAAATAGQGDGNGLIDGGATDTVAHQVQQAIGETGVFWVDLSGSVGGNLIEGGFTTATQTAAVNTASSALPGYFPSAKLGRGNLIYVYESNGYNYYGMSNISAVSAAGVVTSTGTLAAIQAYNIDKKVDDGIATTGNVVDNYITASAVTASATAASGSYTSATCADASTGVYATSGTNAGQGAACGMSFRFQ